MKGLADEPESPHRDGRDSPGKRLLHPPAQGNPIATLAMQGSCAPPCRHWAAELAGDPAPDLCSSGTPNIRLHDSATPHPPRSGPQRVSSRDCRLQFLLDLVRDSAPAP